MPRRWSGEMPRHRRSTPQVDDFDDDDDCMREKPGQRNAANARERARMRILSKAFSRLKTTLPWVPPDTKLSKLDTLRLATSYIAHLRTILTDDGSPTPVVHPLNLTWPFTIQQSPADRDVSRSPAWSSEETSPQATQGHHPRMAILSCIGDSSSCAEGEGEEDPRPYSAYVTDHRHFSDSLLNIG